VKIFLSGDTRSEWQSTVMNRFPGHTFFDPRTMSQKSYKEMAETERAWIDESDIIFAYLSKSNPYAFGTCFEIGYAVANNKLVIYVDEKQVSSSKWIAEHPVFAFDNIESGLEKLHELLSKDNILIADSIYQSLCNQDFRVLAQRELDDGLVRQLAQSIYPEHAMYARLMLATKMLPRRWYDWNLGYVLRRLNPMVVADILNRYPENFYQSEGIAWALGLIGNDDEKIIKFLQDQCARCEDYDAWWCAGHSLEQLGSGNAIEILKRTLTNPHWHNIDHCLQEIGIRPAIIGLLRKIDRNNIELVVSECLKGLRSLTGRRLHNVIWLLERLRLQDRRVVDALTELHDARVEYGSSVAHRIIEALGQIAHPSSRTLLESDLLQAGYFRTRAWAAKGLGLIGDPKSIPILEGALKSEIEPHVLEKISAALYDIKDNQRRADNELIRKAGWLENGMIIDETNKWYWSPEIYDKFSRAEDPQSLVFSLALTYCPLDAKIAVDVGCGTGRFIRELREKCSFIHTIHAVDASSEMVEYVRKSFKFGSPEVKVYHSTIDKIPLPDASVDLIVSSWGFPSKVWDKQQATNELKEVLRLLKPSGTLITIGWDETFSDEMTELWYRFVMEEEYYFDTLSGYRRRKRSKITSSRNCGLTVVKERLEVPVKFKDKHDAAEVLGHLFGYSAGVWILENAKYEFQMSSSITVDSRESIEKIVAETKESEQPQNAFDLAANATKVRLIAE
jgi:SAM-dependent methyltransferase